MSEKEITIKQATIDIKIIRVDGKQMTKAVFRQIEGPTWPKNVDDDPYKTNVKTIIGYVIDGEDWLLFLNHDDKLRRMRFRHYRHMADALERQKPNMDQLFIAV